jgi:D-methionine transport system substrate-binding protein
VSRQDNKDSPKVKNFVKSYESDKVVTEAEKAFNGGTIKTWTIDG